LRVDPDEPIRPSVAQLLLLHSSPASSRTLFLSRHGETEWNLAQRWQGQTDIPLNDRGRAQAAALAERLRGRAVSRIHASDLARASETAEIIARVLGVGDVTIDPDLRERGYGVFEGLTRDECSARHPEPWARYLADRTHMPPGAEPQADLVRRMLAAVARAGALAAPEDGAVLIVSHGGAIRALLAAATGVVPPPMENGATIQVRLSPAGLHDPAPFVD
jgi:broad specificity phosphatase PhoE